MILHLRIIEAKDIPKMDVIGTADPFVLFKLTPSLEEYQTRVIKQNTTPVWNETFHIPFNPNTKPILHMELFDWDKCTANDLISTRDFQIGEYEPGAVFDKWYEFFAAPKVKKPGQVHLVFHIAEPNEEPFVKREPKPIITKSIPEKPPVIEEPKVPEEPEEPELIIEEEEVEENEFVEGYVWK